MLQIDRCYKFEHLDKKSLAGNVDDGDLFPKI